MPILQSLSFVQSLETVRQQQGSNGSMDGTTAEVHASMLLTRLLRWLQKGLES